LRAALQAVGLDRPAPTADFLLRYTGAAESYSFDVATRTVRFDVGGVAGAFGEEAVEAALVADDEVVEGGAVAGEGA